MKRFIKSLVLVAIFVGMAMPSWGQSPSTEGRDFWVTFLRADEDSGGPEKLTLTIAARKQCIVTIENSNAGFNRRLNINPGNTTIPMINDKNACYSYNSEQAAYTALHISSTEDISLFAGNYRDKSFDAANIYPTSALLDDYLIQTYPPSAHADDPQGSHFAIVAAEDNTTVDYVLTAKTEKNNIGAQSVTLNKGQVWYVWTGKKAGDEADLSGTTVKARDGKKIAVFQGCPHTNLPEGMRDRDHIFSQSMPIAYWGSEFGITASRNHRRDIIAVMAINDGTQVYINSEDGEKVLVHTFDFTKDKKHYWTFEIGEEEAYSTHKNSPYTGKLPAPLVIDSSCFLTTSCPAGVHLFMVSNTYDEPTSTHSNGSISDPAMLWISPIEQVIKEINFSTYADGTNIHFMNILTTTADAPNVVWTDENDTQRSLASEFHPLLGNPDYSYARVEIKNGKHQLKGNIGFLAHVYGFGERCSYAYSCGSSTIQRSVTFNGTPLMIDSIYPGKFCVNEDIEMKLNIGNNDYESIVWDYGDGITYSANVNAPNDEKKKTSHIYTVPGWYDLKVSAVYVNPCTNTRHNEEMHFAFRVVRPDTIRHQKYDCVAEDYDGPMFVLNTVTYDCDSVVITGVEYGRESSYSYDLVARDGYELNGTWYTAPYQEVTWVAGKNAQHCDSLVTCRLTIVSCLDMNIPNNKDAQYICPGDYYDLQYNYVKGNIGETHFIIGSKDVIVTPKNGSISLPTNELKPGYYQSRITVQDTVCDQLLEFPIDLAVFYPSNIFKYKFNNVLAVYNKANNGGYEFVGYQWYRNGEAIQGATESVYHTEAPFTLGDVYFVVLTDKNGMTLPSCSQTIETIDLPIETQQAPPATKHLINRQIIIRKGEQTFNIYGQRVQ